MREPFWDRFRRRPSDLQDDEVRGRLSQAILDDAPQTFRQILAESCPARAIQHRLYAVLIEAPEGTQTILVDESGERVGPDFVIWAETPIDLLNVEYGAAEMTATIGDEVWKATYNSA